MSDSAKMALVPVLRFPEFRDAGGWERKPLCKIGEILQGYGFPEAFQGKTQGEYPFYKVSDISNAILNGSHFIDKAVNYIDKDDLALIRARTIPAGTTVFAKIGEAIRSNRRALTTSECLIDNNVAGIKAIHSKANDLYIFYVLSQINLIEYAGGAVPSVNKTTLENIPVFSTRSEEQQKIADCLSSIDELVTAQTQKVEALKAHKKGLMQQLFPAEGETVPKLRFPEFRDAGEWDEQSIQRLIDDKIIIGHLDGNHGSLYPRPEEFSQEGIPYISANDFITGTIDFGRCKHIPMQRALQFKKGVAKDGDVLFAHNATVGPVAKLCTNSQFVILSTTATYFRCNNKYLINDFLKFSLSCPSFVKQYTRVMSQSTRNQVPITTQREFNLQIPGFSEQQKIADCLSSIDELITTQTQKLAALKAHKKGLMQQLFPAIDDDCMDATTKEWSMDRGRATQDAKAEVQP